MHTQSPPIPATDAPEADTAIASTIEIKSPAAATVDETPAQAVLEEAASPPGAVGNDSKLTNAMAHWALARM